MLTPEEILRVRQLLKMDLAAFAKLLNIDVRTLRRWEEGTAGPTASAEGVLLGLREQLDRRPERKDQIIEFTTAAARAGGIAYLLIKLFDAAQLPPAP